MLESVLNGLIRHGRYPQALHRTPGPGLLKNPTLDELALLSGITAIDYLIAGKEKPLDDFKLVADTIVVFEFDLETFRNKRKLCHVPLLPCRIIVVGEF